MLLMVLSPAKSLDYTTPPTTSLATQPQFTQQAKVLVDGLRRQSPQQLGALMGISDKLAALNAARFAEWQPRFTSEDSKQAVLAFNGDVYEGLDAGSLSEADLQWAQQHLRILSGLYGVLRPLDLMRPYRLEMGTPWPNAKGKDLYAYWGTQIAESLGADLAAGEGEPVLVNLASDEYFRSVDRKALQARVVQPVFQDGTPQTGYKIVSFYAKRARGLMARYAILHRLTEVEALKAFDTEGYRFVPEASKPDQWIFRRDKVSA
ncbi:MAG: peroxide stress protein YaaA [Thiomonas sp.]|uniref:peroxide stress protein YaaA n=1 Tax=Thiomonas sp. TaxID=2047785 RepID=UPI002A362D0F|nr:peroxide stress protein YaaA [Thiomonas sp.]MDY0330753.1 peroxide stress protein YaaA [Thiomonas sp.]